MRRSGAAGRETQIGEPTLDPARLQQYRVVITNYETVVNYQFSLAQKVRGQSLWSMMITDEAQKYKAMNTKVSHALKALEPDPRLRYQSARELIEGADEVYVSAASIVDARLRSG